VRLTRNTAPGAATETSGSSESIGGRYRVLAELGRGGMARVYGVHDERSDQRFALKKLFARGERSSTLRAMFEREYQSLVQLAHPHIVRVFDYGRDGEDPYYTMELLEGSDAREVRQQRALSVREACSLLRDCASALGLVHSRRMVHRDIGPRNLWCTTDGRGKLIDFGTLVAMGPQSRIAGTPPFVPPEALYLQPLDARCDLYALGALAYYLLTAQNAFAARSLNDLPECWQRKPNRPELLAPEVPRALSDLVMALLSLDPRGRPSTAAEVYERLSAIAELAVEDKQDLAQAFLINPNLVGRADAIAVINQRLRRITAGRGSTLAIVGPSGIGRSRMLSSVVLHAKLAGATTVSADATAVDSEPLSLAATLVERVIEALPALPAKALNLGPVLGHLSSAVHHAFGSPALAEIPPIERPSKLSAAVVALFEQAARQHRIVMAVDDVQRADGGSLKVLGRLSLLANNQRLLLITTCESGLRSEQAPALGQLVSPRDCVELTPLTAEQTYDLLESLFGAVEGLADAARWIHEVSSGVPQACMQYAQYLVDQRVARYEAGRWTLPAQLREQGLPATLGAMLERRIAALSGDAHALALCLSLARDESRSSWQPETHISIEDFPKLLEQADSERASRALDELLRAGIVQQRDSIYALSQSAMVDALVRGASEVDRKQAHARLARVLSQPNYKASWVAVRQMLNAGDYLGARETIVRFGLENRPPDWGAMRVSLHAQCSREAVDHWLAHRGSPKEGIILRRVLLTAVTVYDWRLARYGDAQLAQLRSDCGLTYWDDTDASLSPLERALECLKRAQEHHEQMPEAERGFAPVDAVRELASCSTMLCRAYVSSYDIAAVRRLIPPLEAMRSLSPAIALIVDQCKLGVDRVAGRAFGEALLETTDRLLQAVEIPELLRRAGAALNLHEQALEDARIGRDRGLSLLDLVAAGGAFDELFIVLHGRWLTHGFLGHGEPARELRKRAEIITEDDVWRQKANLLFEAEYYALCGELQALGRTAERMTELAEMFEGWRPWLAYARGTLARMRGELTLAREEYERALALAVAGEHRAWLVVAPAYAELLLELGDGTSAEQQARAVIDTVRSLGLNLSASVEAQRVLAVALSAREAHESAHETIAGAVSLARELSFGGLPLAKLYETHARVSLASGKAPECVETLKELWQLIDQSEARTLIHAYEMLREESQRQIAFANLPAASRAGGTTSVEASTMFTEVQTLLSSENGRVQRTTEALNLLLQHSGARAGHLFLFDENGLFPAVYVHDDPASSRLVEQARHYLDQQLADESTVTGTADRVVPTSLFDGDREFAPVLLSVHRDGSSVLAGLALLAAGDALLAPPIELVTVIGQCLLAAGDTMALELEY
jgi:hypothetical protein